MFNVPAGQSSSEVFLKAESHYKIQPFDLLELQVYANAGEILVDPQTGAEAESKEIKTPVKYLVEADGMVKFPLVNNFAAKGLTLAQAENLLEQEYATFYKSPFVKLAFANKRAVILGSPTGEIVPLENENMRLTEVLALAKSIDNTAKAHNIRVLRGDEVFIADLTTIEGYRKNNIIIEPNDIIYIEPVRKPVQESLRETVPFITVLSSLATLIFIITRQ